MRLGIFFHMSVEKWYKLLNKLVCFEKIEEIQLNLKKLNLNKMFLVKTDK